jgi:hypothetical protein
MCNYWYTLDRNQLDSIVLPILLLAEWNKLTLLKLRKCIKLLIKQRVGKVHK